MTMREEFEAWWTERDPDTGQSYADCYGSPVIAYLAFSAAYAAGQAAEREACAEICENIAALWIDDSNRDTALPLLNECATAIRNRKEQG